MLTSVTTEAQLWNALWRAPRTTQGKKIATIVLPINVHNVHWYVAFLKLDKTGVKLNIQNNIELRDKTIEAKLMEIGRRYHQKMWDKARKKNETLPVPLRD